MKCEPSIFSVVSTNAQWTLVRVILAMQMSAMQRITKFLYVDLYSLKTLTAILTETQLICQVFVNSYTQNDCFLILDCRKYLVCFCSYSFYEIYGLLLCDF